MCDPGRGRGLMDERGLVRDQLGGLRGYSGVKAVVAEIGGLGG